MTSKIISKTTVHEAKWIALKEITYSDPNGVERKWDTVERTTRKSDADGVEILAILKSKGKEDQIVLVTQFRPPIGKKVLEFPAGLIDADETAEQSALRELQEECGFGGEGVKVVNKTPILVMEPGLSNANGILVHIEIDGDVQGLKPKQGLMEDEFIEVLLFPLDTLLSSITEYQKQNDCVVDFKVYNFAYGLQFKNKSQ
eukprot:Phypoly_transcript_20249.p1 GENE.Phypoly_transcript_20249~~Phypoly_transcript_20249.p1  ORF type:complete len:227 (+),score=32.42 Phypoly_transcript_20249:81-683(+)